MKVTRILFGGPGGADTWADLGVLALRVGAGIGLMTHGMQKLPPADGFVRLVGALGFPAPALFAWLAGLSEFVGGAALMVGLLTRPAAALVLCTMLTAFFGQHSNDPFARKELSFVYMMAATALFFLGAGRFSLDRMLRGGSTRSGR